MILLQRFLHLGTLSYFEKLKGRGAFRQVWTGKMEYLSSIYLRNDSKNVIVIPENWIFFKNKIGSEKFEWKIC